MFEITKIKLLNLIISEVDQTIKEISNERLWEFGSITERESRLHTENILGLEEYKTILLKLKEKIEEGEFDV